MPISLAFAAGEGPDLDQIRKSRGGDLRRSFRVVGVFRPAVLPDAPRMIDALQKRLTRSRREASEELGGEFREFVGPGQFRRDPILPLD